MNLENRSGILSLLLLAAFFPLTTVALETAPTPTATVVTVVGKAWENRHEKIGGDVESPLKAGDHLAPGARLRTGMASNLVLKLGDDVAISIKSETIGKLTMNNGEDWGLDLEGGSVLSAVKNPKKRPDHFSVSSRSFTMGVRGTAFYVRDTPGKAPYLCTCHGTIQVRAGAGKVLQHITTTHHDHPVTLEGDLKKSTAEPEHTDADIAVLEALLK
jgi:hypothetical protein